MILSNMSIRWVDNVKYLGIAFTSGKVLLCDIDGVIRKFYAACNSTFAHTRNLNEILKLHMQEVYVLPIL